MRPPIPATLPPAAWADATFGAAALGDARRTVRLVATAEALAADPAASLPAQLADPAALKGAYRLLGNAAVDFDAVLAPHIVQTRAAATDGVVLLVQDTTELDYTAHPATTDLAPVGTGIGQGFHLQTVLAITPDRMPLGVLAAEAWARQPAPAGETRAQRTIRDRESDIWGRMVEAVGLPPDATTWVHVADRGADCYSFFTACRQQHAQLLVRVVQNRCVVLPDGTDGKLVDVLRAQSPAATRSLTVPARGNRPARETEVTVAWTPLTLEPPTNARRDRPRPDPIPVWAVRVWEPVPPAGTTPLEWLLLTTVPVVTVEDAWDRVDWYTARWLIEELHKGLKSGCRIEAAQLGDRAGLERLLAVLLPVAVRLLGLRAVSRHAPHAPVATLADAGLVILVARATRQPAADTVAHFAAQVARLGGYQDRRGDGPPGWQTLWRGWQRLALLREGAHLAGA